MKGIFAGSTVMLAFSAKMAAAFVLSTSRKLANIPAPTISATHAAQIRSKRATVLSMSTFPINSSSNMVVPAISTALSLCGGAASKKGAIDLARIRLRLDGLHSYAVIATLLMSSSLRLYSSTPKRTKDAVTKAEYFENVIKFIFTFNMMVSVMCGSCTSIVFSLLGLYSKRALGRSNDVAFRRFFDAAEDLRKTGYKSFLVALVTFEISFVLSLFLNYKGWPRWIFLVAASILAWWAWGQWATVITLASTYLEF